MSRICLYLDEDSTACGLVESLRSRGVDVVVVGEVNRYGYSDEEQLRWATTHNRVLYSANIRDFYRIHTDFLSREEFHSGIILYEIHKCLLHINICPMPIAHCPLPIAHCPSADL